MRHKIKMVLALLISLFTASAFSLQHIDNLIPGIGQFHVKTQSTQTAITYQYTSLHGNVIATSQSKHLFTLSTYTPYGTVHHLLKASPSVHAAHIVSILSRTQLGYTGQWHNPFSTQMTLGGFRVYSPNIRRFIEKDTFTAFNTASTRNAYAYVNGNPVLLADPSGHVTETNDTEMQPSSSAPVITDNASTNETPPERRKTTKVRHKTLIPVSGKIKAAYSDKLNTMGTEWQFNNLHHLKYQVTQVSRVVSGIIGDGLDQEALTQMSQQAEYQKYKKNYDNVGLFDKQGTLSSNNILKAYTQTLDYYQETKPIYDRFKREYQDVMSKFQEGTQTESQILDWIEGYSLPDKPTFNHLLARNIFQHWGDFSGEDSEPTRVAPPPPEPRRENPKKQCVIA